MNPFVNPNKREVTLPEGCQDLIDVLKQPGTKKEPETAGHMAASIKRFIQLVLFQAQQDGATELIIGRPLPDSKTPVRYKVKDTWYDMSPFPSHIRSSVISELAKMAKFPEGQILGKGFLEVRLGTGHFKWVVTIMSVEGECTLERVTDLN